MSSSLTSRLGLVKPNPGTGEPVNVATQINATLDKIDAAISAASVTAATRPAAPFDGQLIRETDTRRMYVRNNTQVAWDQVLTSAGGLVEVDTAGKILLGVDTNLYRSAANTLKTDDALVVTGALTSGAITASGAVINSGNHKLMTQANDLNSTGTLNLSTTITDVPGCTWTFFTLRANAMAIITYHGDFETTAGSAGTGIVQLSVDGAAVINPQAMFNGGNTTLGTRASTGNQAHVILAAAGSHTIKIRGQMAVGTTGIRLNPGHTSMNIQIFE